MYSFLKPNHPIFPWVLPLQPQLSVREINFLKKYIICMLHCPTKSLSLHLHPSLPAPFSGVGPFLPRPTHLVSRHGRVDVEGDEQCRSGLTLRPFYVSFFKASLFAIHYSAKVSSVTPWFCLQELLTGCSAGGVAAVHHCDGFRAFFAGSVRVKCLADAGMFLDAYEFFFFFTY